MKLKQKNKTNANQSNTNNNNKVQAKTIEKQKQSKSKSKPKVQTEAVKIAQAQAQVTISNSSNMVIEESVNMHHQHQHQHYAHNQHHQMELNECGNGSFSGIGRTVKSALLRAQSESRVIVGLSEAINVLSKSPEGSLFCLMAVPKDGDSATHMHEVLLEAFCYENDIYVIKVDDATKLSRILGQESIESCCLVQKTWPGEMNEEHLSKTENQLVDYCEAHWDAPQHPIVQLPAV